MKPFLSTKYGVSLIVPNYPCRQAEDGPDHPVCRQVTLRELEEIREKERKRKQSIDPCPRHNQSNKKKFDGRKICWMPFSRTWDPDEVLFGEGTLWPKGLKRKHKIRKMWKRKCPRKLDAYEQRLWIPLCEKPKRINVVCPEPYDPRLCVLCTGSLYTGGLILDLRDKIPSVKRQSEENGDQIGWRIGDDTRITVHKKCYKDYVSRKKENPEPATNPSSSSLEEDSDLCGEERISEEEIVPEVPPIKPLFCLNKPTPPSIDPRKFSRLFPYILSQLTIENVYL